MFWQKSYRLEWYLIIWHYLNLYVYSISFMARLFLLWKLTGAKFNFESMFQQERNLTYDLWILLHICLLRSTVSVCCYFNSEDFLHVKTLASEMLAGPLKIPKIISYNMKGKILILVCHWFEKIFQKTAGASISIFFCSGSVRVHISCYSLQYLQVSKM